MKMIYIRNLKKVFTLKNDSIKAVDSVTLDIEKGKIFGVIGYSGAGKSTFIRLLNRLEEPTAGEILINDERITSLSRESLRKARQEIGMIFQHFNLLWSRTAAENIEFPLEIAGVPKDNRKERVQELINLVDRKSTRLNSSHVAISYAVFCLKKKKYKEYQTTAQ